MSGSEIGVMTTREAYSLGMQQNSPSQPMMQNMRLAFSPDGTAVYQPPTASSPPYQTASSGGGGGMEGSTTGPPMAQGQALMNMGSEPLKRKRGRPRKYGADGSIPMALISAPSSVALTQSSSGGFSSPQPPLPSGGSASSPTSTKKGRGRPPGSGKKQQFQALGSTGVGFTPHVITVKTGEDISSKIMSFSQHGSRAVCVLSANGALSNVTLRQPSTSGGTVTYEGRFEILSLSGSFLLSENDGQRSRTGGLSVSLSDPDGRVLGGGVAGLLMAASPVQVIVGSFIAGGQKEPKSTYQMDPLSAPTKLGSGGVHVQTGAASPPSRGTLSESSGGPCSPLNQSTGACNNNNPQSMSNIPWK